MQLRIDTPDIGEYKEKRLKDEWKKPLLQAHFWIGNRSEQIENPQPRAESQSQSVRSLRSFRDIRALAGLLLLAVAAGPVLPAPAQAATLVSDLGQGTDTETMNASWDPEAQGFMTGTHQTGYSLTSVQLYIDSFVSPATISDLKISLRTISAGNPAGFDTVTFVNPTFTSAGNLTFTLPTDTTIDLTPESRYFVVIDINNADADSGVVIGKTTVTDEDSGAAAGWEIFNTSVWEDGASWTPNTYIYRIAVIGTTKNTPATGLPTITGRGTEVGDILTATTTGISDVEGLTSVSYSYQWIQVDDMAIETNISGATSSTYTLIAADVGKHFKVKVTFQDDMGYEEELKSKLHPERTGGICARTEQVRDAIVAATTAATTCANVTSAHLSGLWPFLNLDDMNIISLKSGDFAGLTRVTNLKLQKNALTSLPAGLFDDLTALTTLSLYENALTSLPAGIFDELTALTRMSLSQNALTSLRFDLFDDLTALTRIDLGYNALSSLPAGLFDDLIALETLVVANNDDLTSLPVSLFTELTALEDLNLSYNALSNLPAGIFDGLTELHTLRLDRNNLSDLPASIFQDLTRLTTLTLQNNPNSFAPTASAGDTQMVATGAAVMLAGSSTGPWGTNVTYTWTQASGTTVTLTGDDTANPSFTAPATAGDLEFELNVMGRASTAAGTDTVTVTVIDPRSLATLSDLTLSSGILNPVFETDTITYTASVLNSVSTLTVTPTTTGSNATVVYHDKSDTAITDTDTNTPPLNMTLAVGMNVINVKVTAEINSAEKTYTVTVTREAPTVTVPGAPTGLAATAATDPTQLDLEWTAPVSNGNSPITGYRIEVSNNGSNGSWTDLEANTGDTDITYEHTGLAPGDTRYYRVSARNALGPSDPSNTDHATTLSGGICARTAQVRDAIVADTPATTCTDVTPAHLMSLDFTLDLTSRNIISLRTGDFAGLTKLYALKLEDNALTSLPTGIFDKLTALEWLDLSNNALTSLSSGLFDRLTVLNFLNLGNNALTSLPTGIFDKLIALETLSLSGTALTELPVGIFDRLTVLETLSLSGTALTELPVGIFDRLTVLTILNLCGTSLTKLELPAFLYDRLITDRVASCLPDNTTRAETASSRTAPGAPQGWIARFGRTVAEQVLDAVEGRLAVTRQPGVAVSIAGQALPHWNTDGSAANDSAAHRKAEEAETRDRMAAYSDWLNDQEDGKQPGLRVRAVTERDLLTGTSFALTMETADGGTGALWGRGAISRFDGREGDLSLEGEVGSVMLGTDWTADDWTVGLLVSNSKGDGSYQSKGEGEGKVSSTVTGFYPYGRYRLNPQVDVWGVTGYGSGNLTFKPKDNAYETDMDLMMAAVGLRGVVLEAPADGGLELAVTTDAMAVRTNTARVSSSDGNLAAEEGEVTRLRVGLEGTWRGLKAGGGELTSHLEVGIRHDDGDAETGFGADIGGGLAWSDPKRGIAADMSARGLLTHEVEGLRDMGIAISLSWNPDPSIGRGPSLKLSQTLGGSSQGGMDALLGRETLADLAANDNELQQRQLDLRLGYGFSAFGDRFTSTPELGLGLSNGQQEMSLGWRLNLDGGGAISLGLQLEATRREHTDDNASLEYAVGLRMSAQF